MTQRVRQYLIDKARQDKPIHYEDVNIDCRLGLDLRVQKDRDVLAKTLGDISVYENQHQRPLLSSMAVYKKTEEHGYGFFEICETMGKGKAALLKEQLYGYEQMALCRTYWRDNAHYTRYYNDDNIAENAEENIDVEPVAVITKPEFFTLDEVGFFTYYSGIIYDMNNPAHVNAKNILMNGVYAKTQYWTEQVCKQLKGFEMDAKKIWQNPGWDNSTGVNVRVNRIKHYTWGKLFRAEANDLGIYFTVGLDVNEQGLIYKLDYEHNSRSQQLTQEQKRLCSELIPNEIRRIVIPFNQIPNYNWSKLVNEVAAFINDNVDTYDSIVVSVRDGVINVPKLKNKLIERDLPYGGHADIPPKVFDFTGYDVDWKQKYEAAIDLGSAGEQLVIKHERDYLEGLGELELAEKVTKVKDGCGYDIRSYFKDGTPKNIEVKTTTGNYTNTFDFTINEIAYSRQYPQQYLLYRLFNYKRGNNTAEVHIYKGCLDEHFHLEAINFTAYKKQ